MHEVPTPSTCSRPTAHPALNHQNATPPPALVSPTPAPASPPVHRRPSCARAAPLECADTSVPSAAHTTETTSSLGWGSSAAGPQSEGMPSSMPCRMGSAEQASEGVAAAQGAPADRRRRRPQTRFAEPRVSRAWGPHRTAPMQAAHSACAHPDYGAATHVCRVIDLVEDKPPVTAASDEHARLGGVPCLCAGRRRGA
jgi:hypothetical protein